MASDCHSKSYEYMYLVFSKFLHTFKVSFDLQHHDGLLHYCTLTFGVILLI